MARLYKLTEQAEEDLNQIYDTIAVDNISAADRFVDNLFEAMDLLAVMPKMGHARLDLTSLPVLFWPMKRYLIVYQEKGHTITILRVLSAYRDIAALF